MRGKTRRQPKPRYAVTPPVDMTVLERLFRVPAPTYRAAVLKDAPVAYWPLKDNTPVDSTPTYVHKAADWYRRGGRFVPQADGGAIVYDPTPGLHDIATGIKLTEVDRMTFERLLTTAGIYRPTESAPGGVVGVGPENRTYAEITAAKTAAEREESMGELKAFPNTAARNTYDDEIVRDIMRKNGGRVSYTAFNEAIKRAGLNMYRGSLARHRLDIKTQNFPSDFDGAPIVLYTDAYGRSSAGLAEARRRAATEAKTKALYVAVVDNGVDINGEPIKSGLAQKQFASFIGTDKAAVTQQALDAARAWERTTLKSFAGEYHVHVGVLIEEAVEPKQKWETISLRTGMKTGGVL